MERQQVAAVLHDLIMICKDGQEGYDTAADAVSDSQHKAVLKEYSQQRTQFISQLQNMVKLLGEQPGQQQGTLPGELHQAWIDLKAALTAGNAGAILRELERGEDAAVETYGAVMAEDLPANVRLLVEQQYTEIQRAHARIRALRDAVV